MQVALPHPGSHARLIEAACVPKQLFGIRCVVAADNSYAYAMFRSVLCVVIVNMQTRVANPCYQTRSFSSGRLQKKNINLGL